MSAARPGGGHGPDRAATAGTPPVLASIWAQDRRRVLGSGAGMLWHVPADFAHFRAVTLGCPVLMGRASWESLGGALPDRTNIVITRTPGYAAPGAVVVASWQEAVDRGLADAQRSGAPVVWVTGGAQIYAQAMDRVDELVITDLDLDIVGAGYAGPVVRAPEIPADTWTADPSRSDAHWRPASGDARWRITTYVRRLTERSSPPRRAREPSARER